MFRANNFDKLLDKATSNLRLDPDWPTILQICDLIRQNDCTPKYAVAAVKKKLYSQNPHQAMFALLTLESIVKNCGSGIHDEVTSKAFCEMLRDLVKTTQHENLRSKILELIQAWAFAFRNSPKYRAVQDTVNILKAEGYKFPALKESDAMFSADTAPEWADGEVCHRCRIAFSLMVRRHHCRACGQVFCQQCSSKTSTLPKFGIEKEVRVCDACFDKVSRPPTSTAKLEITDTSNDYGPTQPQKRPPGGKTAEELQEEEELQLAIALSQSEAEHKEKERKSRPHIAPDPTPHRPNISPTPSSVSASPEHSTQANAELSRYLDRNYWEQRLSRDTAGAAPTAPAPASTASNDTAEDFTKPSTAKAQDDDPEDKEIDEFVDTLKSQIEIFVNRMKSNSSRGRSIANDTAVQTLFMNLTTMHSRLLKYIQQQDDKRVYLESLQDKVSQIRDSRAALDTLRAEHAARLAAAAEAAERQRQMQMAAKLQAMRKKKHEYLQYQRQLALQRVQEQEREMQMRQEQQKHQYMMSTNSGYFVPGMSVPQFPTGYPNQAMYGGPQYHPQMMPQATTDASVPMPGQPQISQSHAPMGPNQMPTVAQSMPHMSNAYGISASMPGVGPSSAGPQPPMNQPNIRLPAGQQMSMPQMMMQQMHQMRMPSQPGMHQIMPQNFANGPPGQKPVMPNQPQQQNPMMLPTVGQHNHQPMMNPNNPMIGVQMQNMRMPLIQGQNPNINPQVPVSGYQINIQNQPNQAGPQPQNPQQPHQMAMQGPPVSLQGPQAMQTQQLPSHTQGITNPNHINSTSQNMISQGPQMHQNQGQVPQQIHQPQMAGHQTNPGQAVQQAGTQIMMQGQQMLPQGQNIPQHSQNLNQLPQGHIPGQQMQGQMAQQMQQIPGTVPQHMIGPTQQMAQGQSLPQNIPVKVQQSFPNVPQEQQQSGTPQQAQTPVKPEPNNNTAELISFD